VPRLITTHTLADVTHIARNMRPRDREEIFATRYGEDTDKLAHDTLSTGPFQWCAVADDGEPIAVIGAHPRWPNVWSAWAFGTARWPEAIGLLTRHVRRFMLPALYNSGAARVDAMSLATHEDARKWLEFLGAKPKEKLDNWGKNGEDFVNYVWTRETTKGVIDKIDQRRTTQSNSNVSAELR